MKKMLIAIGCVILACISILTFKFVWGFDGVIVTRDIDYEYDYVALRGVDEDGYILIEKIEADSGETVDRSVVYNPSLWKLL